MRNIYLKKDAVKICNKDLCVEAKDRFAEVITFSVAFTFICIGITAIAKS